MHNPQIDLRSAALMAVFGLGACASDPAPTGPGTEIATLESNSWVNKTLMPTPRAGLVAATVNGIVYAIGGRDGSANGSALATVETYDPTAARIPWWYKAPLPAPREMPSGAAVINGKIYVPGGLNDQGDATKSLFVYNVAGNTWSTRAKMPVASFGGAAAAINGKLYVLTAPGAGDAAHSVLHRYDPASNRWEELAAPPNNLHGAAVGVINGKLYVAGGLVTKAEPMANLNVYNPVTNQWTIKPQMPTPRTFAAGRVVGGKLYVVGGRTLDGITARTEVYDPGANSWAVRANIPTARAFTAAGSANGVLYVFGGSTATSPATGSTQAYAP